MVLEVIADSLEAARTAHGAGADRIELCESLVEGGITPSYGLMELVRKYVPIDLFVMIRPRGGDFLYSDSEFEVMVKNVLLAKKLRVDGIVTGLLYGDGTVDVKRTKHLVELARPLKTTFHRAFDCVVDPFKALEDIIATGAERILTSGCARDAMAGRATLKSLIDRAGSRIVIMPGGGVKTDCLKQLFEYTGAKEWHTSAKKEIGSMMTYRNDKLLMGRNEGVDEYMRFVPDESAIREMKKLLAELQ